MTEKLPPINGRPVSSEMYSPFRYPSDEEVFIFRDNERRQKQGQKQEGLHIWDKKTASNRTQLRHFKKFEAQQTIQNDKQSTYSEKEKRVIQNALQIVEERKDLRSKGTNKESTVELLDQKKEIFLVSKAHGIIEQEIQKLKQTSEEKQFALEQSNQSLEKDKENFNKYVESSKQQKVDAENRAELEMKEKKNVEGMIKTINIQLTSLKAEKTRNEEAVNNYNDHKKFLDKLAPKDWVDQKEKRRQLLIQQLKQDFLRNKQNTEAMFNQMLADKKFEELEDFEDDYDMFFKNPAQLVDIFSDLEERNLFLIQTTQDSQQNLEELKNKFNTIKQQLDTKIKNLQTTKDQLKKNYDQVVSQLKNLQFKGFEKDVQKDQKELRKQIIELYEIFSGEQQSMHDIQSKETLDILVLVELHLEKQLKLIRNFKPDRVEYFRQDCEQKSKQNQRIEYAKRLKQENEERIQKNQEKIMQPSKKKLGRIPMYRSQPFDKIQEEKEVSVDDEELEDQKYFME